MANVYALPSAETSGRPASRLTLLFHQVGICPWASASKQVSTTSSALGLRRGGQFQVSVTRRTRRTSSQSKPQSTFFKAGDAGRRPCPAATRHTSSGRTSFPADFARPCGRPGTDSARRNVGRLAGQLFQIPRGLLAGQQPAGEAKQDRQRGGKSHGRGSSRVCGTDRAPGINMASVRRVSRCPLRINRKREA